MTAVGNNNRERVRTAIFIIASSDAISIATLKEGICHLLVENFLKCLWSRNERGNHDDALGYARLENAYAQEAITKRLSASFSREANDGWNTIVPLGARTRVILPTGRDWLWRRRLLPQLSPEPHPDSLGSILVYCLRTLFNQGRLAVVNNVAP